MVNTHSVLVVARRPWGARWPRCGGFGVESKRERRRSRRATSLRRGLDVVGSNGGGKQCFDGNELLMASDSSFMLLL
jgi:hypothetical protein